MAITIIELKDYWELGRRSPILLAELARWSMEMVDGGRRMQLIALLVVGMIALLIIAVLLLRNDGYVRLMEYLNDLF